MEYSTQTQVLMTKYNISFQDVMFCTLVSQATDLADSYHAIYNKSTGAKLIRSRTEQQAKELLRVNPSFALCIQDLKINNKRIERKAATNTQNTDEPTQEQRERYTTRRGIIDEMIKNISVLTGKDAAQALQTIAKIQGLDKPDEITEDERRIFVLRFLSHCQTCKLMRLYLEIQKEIG